MKIFVQSTRKIICCRIIFAQFLIKYTVKMLQFFAKSLHQKITIVNKNRVESKSQIIGKINENEQIENHVEPGKEKFGATDP